MLVESGKQDNLGAMTLPHPMLIDFENHKEIIENHEHVGASVIPTPGVLEWSARESRQPLHKGDFVYDFETLDRLPTGSVVQTFTRGGVRNLLMDCTLTASCVAGVADVGFLPVVGFLPLMGLGLWFERGAKKNLARLQQQLEADSLAKQRRNAEDGGGGGQKTDTEGSDE